MNGSTISSAVGLGTVSNVWSIQLKAPSNRSSGAPTEKGVNHQRYSWKRRQYAQPIQNLTEPGGHGTRCLFSVVARRPDISTDPALFSARPAPHDRITLISSDYLFNRGPVGIVSLLKAFAETRKTRAANLLGS
jgi:hypothetical protein